ncbi:MAG: hypothetical protein IJU71_04620 [Selenomonadaceae bacterium]|nr:hypothetical protein [Selenomonadaceae bacterium]
MLEAVIAAAVLGILASIVLPKLSYMLDAVYVDYEIRCLHSTLHYTKSACRLANYNRFGLGQQSGYVGNAFEVYIRRSATSDQYVLRKNYPKPIVYLGETHELEREFALYLKNDVDKTVISVGFDVHGDFASDSSKNDTLVLAKGNVKRTLVLQGYGRMRIDRQ